MQVAAELKREARQLGLGPTAITSTRSSARLPQYMEWIAKGFHGTMKYLERPDRIARRRDPRIILPGAAAVIMTTLYYWPGISGFPRSHSPAQVINAEHLNSRPRGIVSSYAWGRDYHAILEMKLQKLGQWLCMRAGGVGRYYVDTGAILERDYGERAGLGFVGKNSLLINPRAGSGFFLGGLFTTVPLPFDGDVTPKLNSGDVRGKPGCGKCKNCIVACPTHAIVADRVVDARKCISYLTIELKGSIPENLRPKMGTRIYGCDICQQVCPWNKFSWSNLVPQIQSKLQSSPRQEESSVTAQPSDDTSGFSPLFGATDSEISSPMLVSLLWATKASFKDRFRGTAVERVGRDRLARNAAVALGNCGGRREIAALGAASVAHPCVVVREHATWALHQVYSRLGVEI